MVAACKPKTGGSPTYFAYGAKKMITRIAPPGETPTYFHYDGQLNRYCINLAGTPTYYLWDGLRPLEEHNADGSLKARYTHGHALLHAPVDSTHRITCPGKCLKRFLSGTRRGIVAARRHEEFASARRRRAPQAQDPSCCPPSAVREVHFYERSHEIG